MRLVVDAIDWIRMRIPRRPVWLWLDYLVLCRLRNFLSMLLLSSCQFETAGVDGIVEAPMLWAVDAKCGDGPFVGLTDGSDTPVGEWSCKALSPDRTAEEAEGRVVCRRDGEKLELAHLCVRGAPGGQWAGLTLPGGCALAINCSDDLVQP